MLNLSVPICTGNACCLLEVGRVLGTGLWCTMQGPRAVAEAMTLQLTRRRRPAVPRRELFCASTMRMKPGNTM